MFDECDVKENNLFVCFFVFFIYCIFLYWVNVQVLRVYKLGSHTFSGNDCKW